MHSGFKIYAPKVCCALMALALVGCRIERCDEASPSIEFDAFRYKGPDSQDPTSTDTLTIQLSFEDCQGDLGVDLADPNSEFNLRSFLYEWINEDWVRFYPPDSADSTALFAKIPSNNKVKEGIKSEGILEHRLGSIRQNTDTIRFEVYVMDRYGNKSNRVTTPSFILPD